MATISRFWSSQPTPLTLEVVKQTISSAIERQPVSEKLQALINQRQEQFEQAFLKYETQTQNKAQKILIQYNHFAKTLVNCLSEEKWSTNGTINHYFTLNYYHVGPTNTFAPDPSNINLSTKILIASTISLFAFGCAIFPICLPLAAAAMSISLLFMLPLAITSTISGNPDEVEKTQNLERQIFEGAQVAHQTSLNQPAARQEDSSTQLLYPSSSF